MVGRFGRLTVLSRDVDKKRYNWVCVCDCGKTVSVNGWALRSGNTRSCGCLRSEVSHRRMTAHGHTIGYRGTRTYYTWQGVKSRCMNERDPNYPRYGGRGITMCDRWRDSFEAFLEDMGEKPVGTWIERVDNERGYEPENCVWATPQEQNNNRRDSRFLEFNGRSQTMAQWAREVGVPYKTVFTRLSSGWSIERALTEPADKRFGQGGKSRKQTDALTYREKRAQGRR